jgi:hypothetical protein
MPSLALDYSEGAQYHVSGLELSASNMSPQKIGHYSIASVENTDEGRHDCEVERSRRWLFSLCARNMCSS